ncbi:MAG TPA: hypothetical protein VMR73_02265 [Candidatus Paceibacterota bacterium]|nr:hypothetical protein [Candidatus Paceibacterota bacterium]
MNLFHKFKYLILISTLALLPLQFASATSIGTDISVSGNLTVNGSSFSNLLGTGLTDTGSALTVSLSPFTTSNLSEGTNLYYTQARFDVALESTTTLNNLAVIKGLTDLIATHATTTNATSTTFFATTASTTNFFGAGLSTCNTSGSSALTWSGGTFGCNTISGGGFDQHSPGAIGDITPGSGSFSSLTLSNTSFTLPSVGWVALFEANRLTPVSDGTTVSTFTDASGNADNATQSGSARPLYESGSSGDAINGQPVLHFSGSQYMQTVTGGQSLTGNWYMGAVVRPTTLSAVSTFLAFGNESNGERREMLAVTPTPYISFNGYNADVVSSQQAVDNTAYFIEITKSGSTVTVYEDGTQIAQGTPSLNSFASAILTLGANNAGGENFIGDFALGMFLNSVPSANTLASIRGYVEDTYGITVANAEDAINPILQTNSSGQVVASGLSDDGSVLSTTNRQTYFVSTGNNREHVLKVNWNGTGFGGNVLKLQQLNSAGFSVVYGVGNDVPDGTEGYGWAGGWGNNGGGAAPYTGSAFNEAYNEDSTTYYPFRIIQTNTSGPSRRFEIAGTSGDITFFGRNATYPSETPLMTIKEGGAVGIGTTNPAAALDIDATSTIIEQSSTPSSSSAACTTGTISWDTGFVYVCVSTNTWKRSALLTF